MKSKLIPSVLVSILLANTVAIASESNIDTSLQDARRKIVKQYILDLQKADYQDITQLFDKNGIVISTSKGKINAKEFFYAFLPEIISANTQEHQTFVSSDDNNHLGARFHFKFKLKDGETGEGEYTDEFVFMDNSAKLEAVYMFENLKFS
jgi:hypothetical protein